MPIEKYAVPFIDGQMKTKKLTPDAVTPVHAKENDAGYDLVAIDDGTWADDRTYIEYRTGITLEVPLGYHTELFPRSSISKTDLVLANSVGLVDNGYRGELRFRFKYIPRISIATERAYHSENGYCAVPVVNISKPILYKKGDKVGQVVIRKTYDLPVIEVEELSETDRGDGGFGSTGK